MRKTTLALATAGAFALGVAACTSSGSANTRAEPSSGGPLGSGPPPDSVGPTSSGTLPDVPPPEDVPAATADGPAGVVEGHLLAFNWTVPGGGERTGSPDDATTTVTWPAVSVVVGQVVEMTIATAVAPVNVDIRAFSSGIDENAVPTGEPEVFTCAASPGTPSSGCSYDVATDHITVSWLPEPAHRRFVLSSVWHIPDSAAQPGDPVDVSANWAFGLFAQSGD